MGKSLVSCFFDSRCSSIASTVLHDAINMMLSRICSWAPVPAARRPQLSIESAHRALSSKLAGRRCCCRSMALTPDRMCSVYFAGSVNKATTELKANAANYIDVLLVLLSLLLFDAARAVCTAGSI